jgi:hypothetical protein
MQLKHLSLLLALLFCACHKNEKAISLHGQILLSKKFPLPFVRQKIDVYQAGSPSIPFPISTSGSSATGVTDSEGRFNISFKPGTTLFLIFRSRNTQPVTLSAGSRDTSLFNFRYSGFADFDASTGTVLYASKIIDTAVISMTLVSDIFPTDTVGIQLKTLQGFADKSYTGLNAKANSTIVLDTIYNVALQDYDGLSKRFRNSLYAGRKVFSPVLSRSYLSSVGFPRPSDLSAEDESKVNFLFYFQ